jgi:hypothetical protein
MRSCQFLLALSLAGCASRQLATRHARACPAPGLLPVQTFAGRFEFQPDSFAFVVDSNRYVVTGAGSGFRASDHDRFVVPVPDSDDYIVRLFVSPYKCDLIFTIEYDDGEDGGGHVVRLSPDSATVRWHAKWFGFNVSEPLIRPPYLYVAAIGTIGKIDMATGQYVWRRDDLYERETGAYGYFDKPEIHADTLVFRSMARERPRRLLVSDSSGVVLSR